MAHITTFRCDVCGKLKQEANHWFRLLKGPGPVASLTVTAWEDPALGPEEMHLCGMECVQKAVGKAMER
jgi:hypothetical protein